MTKGTIDALAERLRPHYRRFLDARAEGEVLLTAHSHQAWPDVSREGQLAAWDDAARWVDGKWSHVF
ncbi:MAG: kynureninase, partial [Deltaproteobacteria bacterium]